MRRAAALAVAVMALTACETSPQASPTSVAAGDRATSAPTSPAASPSSASSTVAPVATPRSAAAETTPATTPTTSTVACPPFEVVVVGNSTDYTPVASETITQPSPDAWPAVAGRLVDELAPDLDVTVVNASVRGGGTDVAMMLASSIRDRVTEVGAVPSTKHRLLVLVPSLIDLQLKDLDVDASADALEALADDAAEWFTDVAVVPMTPVAAGLDADLSDAIAAFNDRIGREGLLTTSWTSSPLLAPGSVGGAPEFYDDFDDEALATPGPDPDGIHPDTDGHRRTAEVAAPWLVERLGAACDR